MISSFQYRNNDPSENVQYKYTDGGGRGQIVSFVATLPHWVEQTDIRGDLFNCALEDVFNGEAIPIDPGSDDELELIASLREHVEDRCPDWQAIRNLNQPMMTSEQSEERSLSWLLTSLIRRRAQAHS